MVSSEYMLGHCRGELGRGKVERCPKSWLVAARKLARESGDLAMAEACSIALRILRGELADTSANIRPMQRLTGRKTVQRG
jgi:hypothetical protein